MSLSGKRILVTRTRHQASELASQLAAHEAIPILVPTIEIGAPESFAPLDAALAQLSSFDWLIFTSANAVEVFGHRWKPGSTTLPKIAVIGSATERAVQGIGLRAHLLPQKFVAEALAESLIPHASGSRMLLIRGEEARDVLPESLTRAGATVTIAPAYRNSIPSESIAELKRLYASDSNYPDAVTLTSASTAHNFFALAGAAGLSLPHMTVFASIGPITSAALRESGFEPEIEASEATIPSLVQALERYFNTR